MNRARKIARELRNQGHVSLAIMCPHGRAGRIAGMVDIAFEPGEGFSIATMAVIHGIPCIQGRGPTTWVDVLSGIKRYARERAQSN